MAFIRMSARARDVMDFARREAAELRHSQVGTEHLLLGILREGGGVAARLTSVLRLKVDLVRQSVALLNKPSSHGWVSESQLPFSENCRRALQTADGAAMRLAHEEVAISHLFLGLLENPESRGALILTNLGLDLQEAKRDLLDALAR